MKEVDISSEEIRVYEYDNDTRSLRIEHPATLFITEDGGHRVQDRSGWVHYVHPGWSRLRWKPQEGAPAVVA